jgi:uncharacterized protein (DUF4415 family)
VKKNITKNVPNKSKIDWEKVDSVPEDEYNYDDAPEATLEFFKTAKIRMPNSTKPITMRIKSDTLEFFKKTTTHYQTLINSVLDAYVEAQKQKKTLAH